MCMSESKIISVDGGTLKKECAVCSSVFETYKSEDCDTCSTECGYKYREHGVESKLEEIECASPNCDTIFKPDCSRTKFCSTECAYGNRSSDEKSRVLLTCQNCKEIYKILPAYADRSSFCSRECKNEHQEESFQGEGNPAWNSVKIDCRECNKSFNVKKSHLDSRRFCSNECYRKWRKGHLTGEDNPAYNPDYEPKYGDNWDEMREKVLKRDDSECVVCGKDKEDIGREPDVHHIIPIYQFDEPEDANYLDNLVTLCTKHHRMSERWGLAPDNRRK
jgi:5-methylcytosine-specific restriction endonuclease McrA